jgi:hypothetical protein
MSSEFTGPRSYYDTTMDMCLPCVGAGGDRCVFTPSDNDQSWIMQAARRAAPALRTVRRFRADGTPEPFPACDASAGTIVDCYFQEDGNYPNDIDSCYDAAYGTGDDLPLPSPDWNGNNTPQPSPYSSSRRKAKTQAAAVAQARSAQCPFYVCSGGAYRAANGVIAFSHEACRCADKTAAKAVKKR